MRKPPMRLLALFALLCSVSACAARPPPVSQSFPSYADLRAEAKPQPSIDTLTSDKAGADYDAAVEAWGTRGWQTVGRICAWAKAMGAPKLDCTAP